MNKFTQPVYLAPHITLRVIEVESAICSGSIDIQNPNTGTGRIVDQSINNDFDSNYTSTTDNDWTIEE